MFRIYWPLLMEMVTMTITTTLPREDCIIKGSRLFCNENLPNISLTGIIEVKLTNMNWTVIDLDYLTKLFPNVQNLTIESNENALKYVRIVHAPLGNTNIKVLRLTDLQIANLSENFLEHLPALEELNLRENFLTKLNSSTNLGQIRRLHLSGNRWNCSENLEWILRIKETSVKDLDETTCYGIPYPGKSLFAIAKFLQDTKDNCTENCECNLLKVVMNPESEILEPIIEVNCSDRGFTELPNKFPTKTKIFHLEHNVIEDLRPLRENLMYRKVSDLYLDENRVKSIDILEGSYWLTHFRVFSLNGNRLSELPSYALDNALQQNVNMPNAVRLSLGGNPWRCDCVFTPAFQELLQKYASQIRDLNEVKCTYVEGDENSLLPIIELSRSSVCRFPTEYSLQEALDLLNAVLASLIIFVLGKLAYDYYHFKKSGRLPWIVTKMT